MISVIIPTLNEPECTRRAVRSASQCSDTEIIVVQATSASSAPDPMEGLPSGVRVLESPPGRARQMNCGAQHASGDILLFLHADTQLPAGYDEYVHTALQRPATVAGAFSLRIDAPGAILRVIERAVAFRSRVCGIPYGDQALFLHKRIFDGIGGFPMLPIMEDVELVRNLHRRGRVHTVPARVLTSARRWQRLGAIRTTLLNQAFIAAYLSGVSPDWIARRYDRRHSSLATED